MDTLTEINAANDRLAPKGLMIQQRSNGKFSVWTRDANGFMIRVKNAGKFETVADALAFAETL